MEPGSPTLTVKKALSKSSVKAMICHGKLTVIGEPFWSYPVLVTLGDQGLATLFQKENREAQLLFSGDQKQEAAWRLLLVNEESGGPTCFFFGKGGLFGFR